MNHDVTTVLNLSEGDVLSLADLQTLQSAAQKSKPHAYNSVVEGIAQRYSGDQAAILRAALKQRFARTYDRMPVAPVNWLRFIAEQDSGVYSGEVNRTVLANGAALPVDDPRSVAFLLTAKDIDLDGLMARVEQQALSGAHTVAVSLGWQRVALPGDKPRALAHVYWPHQIEVVCHPDLPGQDEGLLCVILTQQRGMGDDGMQRMVWMRSMLPDLQFGPWQHCTIGHDGISTPLQTYEAQRLPIVFLRLGQPVGYFPEPDRDISAQVDSLNVSKSNETYVVELQAHAQPVYRGEQLEAAEIAVGPDEVVKIGREEALDYIVAGADFTSLRQMRELSLRELAVSHSASADSYSPSAVAPASGVARQIANIPHDSKVKRTASTFRAFEERYLLPCLVELMQVYDDSAPDMTGVTVAVDYELGQFESEAEKADKKAKHQALVKEQLDAGLISKARAAVELDLYPTIEDAVATGLSDSANSYKEIFGYHIDSGVVSVDDVRASLGLRPVPGAEGNQVPAALTTRSPQNLAFVQQALTLGLIDKAKAAELLGLDPTQVPASGSGSILDVLAQQTPVDGGNQ